MAEGEEKEHFHSRLICPSLNIPASPPSFAHRYDEPLSYFLSIPWCASRLTAPDTHTYLPSCRNPAPDLTNMDAFFTYTLGGSPDRLLHMISFFRCPPSQLRDPELPIREVSTFASLGERLTGVKGILHGGVTMALVDEAMSQIIEVNTALRKDGGPFNGTSVTGTLECKFLRGIPAEGVVMATARLEGTERRKTRVVCELVNEDGEKLASVKSVWISLLSKM